MQQERAPSVPIAHQNGIWRVDLAKDPANLKRKASTDNENEDVMPRKIERVEKKPLRNMNILQALQVNQAQKQPLKEIQKPVSIVN